MNPDNKAEVEQGEPDDWGDEGMSEDRGGTKRKEEPDKGVEG